MDDDRYIDLSDLKPDKKNARKHNPRNIGMITEAIQEVGVSRSGVIDEDGNILAGNGTYEALSEAGIRKVKVVDVDGSEWVVVRRKGLSAAQKVKVALFDNRSAELAEWDKENLGILNDEHPGILDDIFYEDELDDLLAEDEKGFHDEVLFEQAVQLTPPKEYLVIMCENEDEFVDIRYKLGLGDVRRGGYKKGSAFDANGKERVVHASHLISRLKDVDSDTQ